MISQLQELLIRNNNNLYLPCLLPAMHTTECYNAEQIYKSNKIKLHLCDKLNQKLIYFFMGNHHIKLHNMKQLIEAIIYYHQFAL